MNTDIEYDEDTVTLGVSDVLRSHGSVHPDLVRRGAHIHRATDPGDATTSSECPEQTSSEHHAVFRQHAVNRCAIGSSTVQRDQQSSNTEDHHVYQ